MAELLTDDMDIRDTILSMDVGGNGDYYLSLKETKNGKVVKLDTRIATSGGNATPEILKAVATLYKALLGQKAATGEGKSNIPDVIKSVCDSCGCEHDLKVMKLCPDCLNSYLGQTVL